MLHKAAMTATVVYIVPMAIPFMPAVEIGLTMPILFGSRIAFLIYMSTVAALILSYAVGRLLPANSAARAFGVPGFDRARKFVERMIPLSTEERIALIARESPAGMAPFLLLHRFIALAVLLNLPGNVLIGGGGGIALVAGMSRLYSLPAYLLTSACAVAPVPLTLFLTEQL